jgi:cyclase
MLRKRLIPRILLQKVGTKYSSVVSRNFERFITVGDPLSQFRIMDSNKSDEISVINIHRNGLSPTTGFCEELAKLVKASSTPISAGGGIRLTTDVDEFMKTGIEKISIPIQADSSNLALFNYASRKYGKQAVQATLDYFETAALYRVRKSSKLMTLANLELLVNSYLDTGAGEIVFTNVDRDGSRGGLDFALFALVNHGIDAPILLAGGAHSAENFVEAFNNGVDGVISGTYLAKMDQSLLQLRSKIAVSGVNVRNIK